MTTAGETTPGWSQVDSDELDDAIVRERRVLVGFRGRAPGRCAMEVRPWGNHQFRCGKHVVRGSNYCVKHLGGS